METKENKHLSYNLVLGIGICLIIIGEIIFNIPPLAVAGEIFSIVSAIMIFVQTVSFDKKVSTKTKLIGWLLILLWIVEMAIRSQL